MAINKRNLIFLGAPGSGKGTMAAALLEVEELAHISTGDLLRDEIKRDTELGREASKVMQAGGLVPDDVVVGMVKNRLAQADCAGGFILDGFPRTLGQAEKLDDMLTALGKKIDAVVNIVVSDETIITRLSNRLNCRGCKEIYNRVGKPSKVDGVCDACGGELFQRADDTAETVKGRLDVFHSSTKPLIDYYNARDLIVEISGNDVKSKLSAIIEALA